MSMNDFITIENWSVVTNQDGYKAPEMVVDYLQGNVYGHPNFEDGEFVLTSPIIAIDSEAKVVTTYSGSNYKLGKIDPNYEEKYSNAEERFWANE